mgnify:CR=1 FL=1
MRKILFLALVASIGLSSCSTQFAITTGDESLSALTQVTDNEEPCITPFGGDNGKDLLMDNLDGNIEFMDTPGVLLPNFDDEDNNKDEK